MKKQTAQRLRRIVPLIALAVLARGAMAADNPKDPFEGFNRAMFQVNEGIDVVVKPVAKGYDEVAPLPVKAVVGNFFGNLYDAWTAVNNLLQGKPGDAASDAGRVLVNTVVGIGGAFDIASEMGLTKHSEDFGQTLAVWGVGDGPYFYWPIIGPRTTRDTAGWAVDSWADPVWGLDEVPVRNSLVAVRFIDTRAALLPSDKVVEEAAFDKYNYIRDAYLQHRHSAIRDGAREKDDLTN
ncbi:MlaA family lipoprotein [Rhodocyclus tenuis]|uniref:Phospholipid-binding lipoprotein MlaA n=1 Tax=Rhodocyclus tenuis TaxID=1066 RepID=A0A840G4P6_RHOTE|nr:VacJ family lipoprotein [Rhodocyclus tenuis]MBB4246906.1 phospholipid-binding lipoprotein MlaA [Rhodocyclus tenuis]